MRLATVIPRFVASGPPASRRATPRRWLLLAAVAVTVLAADQIAKHLVTSELALGESVSVAGPLQITHARNPGMAFGLFPDGRTVLIVIGAVLIATLLVAFRRLGGRHRLIAPAAGLLLGGAASNLADRVRLEWVVDFLDPGYGGASNVADQCIAVGAIGLALALALTSARGRAGSAAGGERGAHA